jgi:hypothetical protein
VLDGISAGPYSSITLDYRKQFDGFKKEKFEVSDLISLRIVEVE